MDNVIPFPTQKDEFDNLAEWISGVCREAGLNQTMIDAVLIQYCDIHSQLFSRYESVFEWPEIGLTHDQIDAIAKAHSETVERTFDHFRDKLANAAHIIIGLLAREQLDWDRCSR